MSGPHSLRAHQPAPPAHGPEDSAGADGAGEPCALAVAAPPAAVDLDRLTAGGRMTAAGRGDDPRDHLLCVDGDRSWTVELPAAGELIVGRSPQAAIVLEDKLVSRAHLRLEIGPAELVACDLGSRHGTRVNGEPLGRARPVHSGDVLAVGGAVMVVRRTPRHMSGALDHGAFLARLAEELTRAAGRDRELAVAVLRRGDRAAPDRAGAEAWLADHLAVTEHRAFLDERHLAVILPELELEEAQARILALVAATQLAAGIAVAPYDATSPDVLLSTARVAAERASAATVVGAAELTERVALGPQTAIVADPGMSQVYALARRLARTGMPVSIHGETGAGKELIALALHHHSERAAGPFVARGDIEIVARQSHSAWSPEQAQRTVEDALARAGDRVDAILANNSGMARGAVTALAAAGLHGVFVAGADADAANVNFVCEGKQSVEVLKDIQPLAETAADVAARLLRGEAPAADAPTQLIAGAPVPVSAVAVEVIGPGDVVRRLVDTGFLSASEVPACRR